MKTDEPIPTELLKGNVKTLILAILRDSSLHGYGITQAIEARTHQELSFRQGALYPILHELEEGEMIVGSWIASGRGRPKKIYNITERGLAELERGLNAWRKLSLAISRVSGEELA